MLKTGAHGVLTRTVCLATLALAITGCGGDDDDAAPPTAWQGKTYSLVIPIGAWFEPDPAIGREFGPYVPDFLLRVDQSAGTSHSATVGASIDGVQNLCNPTGKISGAGAYPNATFGPTAFPLHIHNVVDEDDPADDVVITMTVDNLTFENVLPNGGTPATEGTFSATLRAREVYPLITGLIVQTPDAFCEALSSSYEVPCEPCPTDGEPYCVTLKAIGLGATETTTPIEPVTLDGRDASCADVIPAE